MFSAVFVCLMALFQETRGDENLADLRGVWQANFNLNASRIVLQMRGRGISLWDAATGKAVCQDFGSGKETDFYVLRPDRKAALISFRPRGALLVDLTTGEPVSPPFDIDVLQTDPGNTVFSPDMSTLIAFDRDRSAHVFDSQTGKLRVAPIPTGAKAPEDMELERLAKFTADGACCFLSDLDGSVVRYDTKTWKTFGKPIRHPRQEYSQGFDISADGKWLVTFDGGGDHGSKDMLQMWEVETAKPVGKPINAVEGVVGQFLTEPRRLLVRTGRIGSGVYALPTGTLRFPIAQHDNLYGPAVAVSPDGKWLLSHGADRFLTLQDASSGERRGGMSASCHAGDVLFAPDSQSCFVVFDNSAFILEHYYDQYVMRVRLPEMKINGSIRVLDYIHRTELSADGRKLLILQGGTDKERVSVFDTVTMKAAE